jgi:hypothetical protein
MPDGKSSKIKHVPASEFHGQIIESLAPKTKRGSLRETASFVETL